MLRITNSLLFALLLSMVVTSAEVTSQGKTFLTVKQALALAFPKCKIKRQSVILTKEQCKRVGELSGRDFVQRFVNPYVATRKGKLIGTAYFDNHKVRTLKQTLMVVITPDQKIARIELLRFGEPPEFAARKKWFAQFEKQKLDKNLNLKRKIRGMTGASLTARASTNCARRILALHKIISVKPVLVAKHQPVTQPSPAAASKKASKPRPAAQASKQ